MMELSERTETLLFGRDPVVAVRLAGVAASLFLVAMALHVLARFVGPLSPMADWVVTAVFAAMLVAAMTGGYRNDGALVCVALAAGVGLGFYLPAVAFEWGRAAELTLEVLAVGTAMGVALGLAGFLGGAGLRRLVGP